jgi:8-oxo-dGTP pyrophosphatase MutT (NUDIX family)
VTDDLRFPTVRWGDLEVTFHAASSPASGDGLFAVVVFAIHAGRFVLADTPDRGWITPSGRLEAGETPLQAAVRETWEEIGGELREPQPIGYYELRRQGADPVRVAAYIGRIDRYGDIPEGSESRGARLVALKELPGCYWRWDSLLDSMFLYASKIAADSGTPDTIA